MQELIKTHVLTGFLGTGKTSFLNALLQQEAFRDSAVIINEFGEVSLDHLLVEESDDQVIELANGCICCTIRGQLVDSLQAVLLKNPARIIIETTGLADPLPILQAILHAPNLSEQLEFAGLVTMVDGLSGIGMIEDHIEAQKQIALADLICVSKLDHEANANSSDPLGNLAKLKNAVHAINPIAEIVEKEKLLAGSDHLFELGQNFEIKKPDDHAHGNSHHHSHDHSEHQAHSHSHTHSEFGSHESLDANEIKCVTLTFEQPIERLKIDMFTQLLLSAHGPHIIRLKGLVALAGEARPLLLQAVGSILSEPLMLEKWPSDDHSTRIVVFISGMEEDFLNRLFLGFMGTPQIDVADADGHMNNPLSISGFKPKP